jgi:hypothetical protein
VPGGDRGALPRQRFCPCRQRRLFCQILEAFWRYSVCAVMCWCVMMMRGDFRVGRQSSRGVIGSRVGGWRGHDFQEETRTNYISPQEQTNLTSRQRENGSSPRQLRLDEYRCIRKSHQSLMVRLIRLQPLWQSTVRWSRHKASQGISLRFSECLDHKEHGALAIPFFAVLDYITLLPLSRYPSSLDFQALGKPGKDVAAARVQYMYLSSVHTARTLPKVKQTQKTISQGTSCLMQESSSSPVICLGTAPSV